MYTPLNSLNMEEYEIYIREGIPRLRKKVDRSIEASSKKRLKTLIQFSEAAHSIVGKKKEGTLPPAAEAVKEFYETISKEKEHKVIEVTEEQAYQIIKEMQKKGITKLKLPYKIKVVPSPKPAPEISE